MTKNQVERLLGSPQRSFTEDEYRRGRRMVVAGTGEDWLLQNEYWFYEGVPTSGTTMMVVFHEERVHKVSWGPG